MSTVNDELNNLGKKIVQDAKKTVPVDTGKLKNSINYETTFISNDNFQIVIHEKKYGVYVDKGTRKQKAQPYMSDAIEKNLDKGIKNIINVITGEILQSITQIK